VDQIDLYQIHWPFPDAEIEEGWEALTRLKEEGKLRFIGVSNFNVSQLERVQKIAKVTSLQPPYSAVHPEVEAAVLPYCLKHAIGVIAYSPMQAGLLTGGITPERVAGLPEDDWRRRGEDFQEPRLTRNLKLQRLMAEIGSRHGHSSAVVALAWVLRSPQVTGAIVGARRPSQVDGFIGAMEFRLGPDEVEEVGRFLKENP
jgi:aryl-alcohol dehydrogenase-like predicted oxidoreductase